MILSPTHHQVLMLHGLTPTVITESQFRSVDAREAAEILRWRSSRCGGIAMPYYDLNKEFMYERIRLDHCFNGSDTMSPKDITQCLYLPPSYWDSDFWDYGEITLVVGEFNALSAAGKGWPTLGVPSLSLLGKDKGASVAKSVPVLEHLPLHDKQVVLEFAAKHANTKALESLIKRLENMGAIPLTHFASKPITKRVS